MCDNGSQVLGSCEVLALQKSGGGDLSLAESGAAVSEDEDRWL